MKTEKIEDVAELLALTTFNFLSTCDEKENALAKIRGLTQVELKCMRLFKVNEVTNNKRIAEKMNLSPSRLTRIIDGLVTKGYIRREIDRQDRRNMRLYLSENGCGFIQSINREYIALHCKIIENVEPEHREEVVKAFTTLFGELEKWYTAKTDN